MSFVTGDYVRTMARYNAWQNKGLRKILQDMPESELTRDRGAFFGSILGTANHLLWGDLLWMARFDGGDGPGEGVGLRESPALCPDVWAWETLRYRTDGRIRAWADRLHAVDLTGDMTWRSVVLDGEITRPVDVCVTHFFNHQTHHRGQIHAMLTAAGVHPGDTDLIVMPEP